LTRSSVGSFSVVEDRETLIHAAMAGNLALLASEDDPERPADQG
jgi:hypothetical protein